MKRIGRRKKKQWKKRARFQETLNRKGPQQGKIGFRKLIKGGEEKSLSDWQLIVKG